MRPTYLPGLVLVLLAVLVVPAGWAAAQVRDAAGFFTPNAVERANQLISQFRQQTGRDLLVETVPGVPANQQGQLQSMGKARFFDQYTEQMARQSGIKGVYVLICRDPSYLKVAVGNETMRSGAFTAADRDQLRDTLVSNFKAKNYDEGLLAGVSMVQRTLTANSARTSGNRTLSQFPSVTTPRTSGGTNAAPAPPQRSSGHSGWFWLIIVGGGLLVLIWFLRRMAARATSGYAGGYQQAPPPLPGQQQQTYGGAYPGYGAGGGGFGRGLLGGLLGGAAGGWLYDRMSHRGDTGAAGYPGQGGTPAGGNPDAYPSSAPDTDFSVSSGGDFGGGGDAGGGGGGDFGGGGGGDFGGGGGGGDDSGGGSF